MSEKLHELLEQQSALAGHTAMRRNRAQARLTEAIPKQPPGIVVHQVSTREYLQLTEKNRDEHTINVAIQQRLSSTAASVAIDHDVGDGLVLDAQQRCAVEDVCQISVLCVTGPPGVGKTTILRHALHHLDKANQSYVLCALSGKAAQRMTEATGRPASTIHRFLGWNGKRFMCEYVSHDVVIIDEASMVDSWLLAELLGRCSKNTRIVMVGDVDQLPPVGAGQPFYDIIESGIVPTVRLSTLYRQSEQSWVCRNAPKIITGEWDKIELDVGPDFQFLSVKNENALADAVVRTVQDADENWQVLSPQKAVPGGTIHLNRVLSRGGKGVTAKIGGPQHGEYTVHLKERVMQMKNNYQLGVMNGTVGHIVSLDSSGVDVEYPDYERGGMRIVKYTRGQAKQLVLAYATTVHKFQGSEANDVIVVCHDNISTKLRTRQVLYTAITRAKKKLTIVGTVEAFRYAVANNKPRDRQTLLGPRLRGEI